MARSPFLPLDPIEKERDATYTRIYEMRLKANYALRPQSIRRNLDTLHNVVFCATAPFQIDNVNRSLDFFDIELDNL